MLLLHHKESHTFRVTNHHTDQTKKKRESIKPGLTKHFSVSRACRVMIMTVQILLLRYFGELHFFLAVMVVFLPLSALIMV